MQRVLFATILAFGLTSTASAGSITYNIQSYSALQNGFSLSGTFTTDGTIGNITAANITSWAYIATNGTTSFGGSSSGLGANLLLTGTVTATSTQLTIPVPLTGSFTPNRLALDINFGGDFFLDLDWQRSRSPFGGASDSYSARPDFPNPAAWASSGALGTLPLPTSGQPWVIAVAPDVSAVPEPGTITLMLIGVGGLFGFRLVRRDTPVELRSERVPQIQS